MDHKEMDVWKKAMDLVETQYQLAIRLKFTDDLSDLNDLIKSVRKLLIGTRNYLIKK